MNKVGKRLLTFFIGIPLVFLIVYCDYLFHLPLQIVLGIFATLGANELYNMISKKHKLFAKEIILIPVALLPFVAYLFELADMSLDITPWFFICEVIIILSLECFTSKEFEFSIDKISYSILIIFYCGFLMTFLSRMAILDNSKFVIILFLIFVFMCDSCAWFFGMIFGKNNRGFIAASPNKSITGFIGGIIGSICCGLLFKFIFPEYIHCTYPKIAILGLVTSVASIVGDLIESVFKRSCDVKDSGILIPGRGGILDSIDSVLIAAPVFYIAQNFLFY